MLWCRVFGCVSPLLACVMFLVETKKKTSNGGPGIYIIYYIIYKYNSIILRKLAFRQKRRSLDSGQQMKLQGTPKPGRSNGHDRQRTPKKRDSTCISTSSLRGNWTMLVVTLCSYVFVGVFYSVPTCQRSPACSFRTHPKTDPGVPKYPTTHGSHASQTDPTKTTVGTKHLLCLPAAD